MKFTEKLDMLMKEKGLSRMGLSKESGIPYMTIVNFYEKGSENVKLSTLRKLADFFNVSLDFLADDDIEIRDPLPANAIPIKGKSIEVPLYGSIAAGVPLEMIQIEEYIEIPESVGLEYLDAFLLRVNGDSMNKIVPNGMYALIAPHEEAKNGDIVAINVNGYEATLKRFYKLQNTIVLEPDSYNPDHSPIVLDCTKGECEEIKILGKMVWFMSPFGMKF